MSAAFVRRLLGLPAPAKPRGRVVDVDFMGPRAMSASAAVNAPASPPAPRVVEHTGTEIVACRFWTVDVRADGFGGWDARLVSPYRRLRWDGPVCRADQPPDPDEAPHGHGIHAWPATQYRLQILGDDPGADPFYGMMLRSMYPASRCMDELWATGLVALSGLVVEGEHGYRAEAATVQSLRLHGQPSEDAPEFVILAALSDRYQCEVERVSPEVAPVAS